MPLIAVTSQSKNSGFGKFGKFRKGGLVVGANGFEPLTYAL